MINQEYYKMKQLELEKLISQIEFNKKTWIPGTLRISSDKGRPRYYHRLPAAQDAKSAKPSYHYLSKKELGIAKQLAQQEYEQQVLTSAKRLLNNLQKGYGSFDDHGLQDIYLNLHKDRKELVSPIIQSDDEYAADWLARSYEPGFFSADTPPIYAENGERVRSKTEKIIADKYYRLNIPYLYELPWQLKAGQRLITVRPDFTVLNKRTRQQFIHEHFGMIDTPEYAENFLKKIELYAANNIHLGANLLITMESSKHVMNEQYFSDLIQRYLQ